jgi:NADH:ubiquinone oxidoreductase subunit 2 (subunit N)
MSGIPPLGGFFVKLDILSALLDNSHFFTNYVLFFFTVISFFYYLRVIKIMFFDNQDLRRSGYPIAFSTIYSLEYPRNEGRI